MIDLSDQQLATELHALARRYHPAGVLDVDDGYADLPEVRARRAIQRAAAGADEWRELQEELRRIWPSGRVMDFSTLHLDCARQLRVMHDEADPGHHLVAWLSLLAPVALIYESRQPIGQRPVVTPPDQATDADGIQLLTRAVQARGWRVLPWDLANRPVPGVSVGNLLPGEATLASCLFSSSLR